MNLEIEELESIVAPDGWDNARAFLEGFAAGAATIAAIIVIT